MTAPATPKSLIPARAQTPGPEGELITELRKSATRIAARERARQKAAEFRARDDQLEQLAADYFVLTDQLEQITAHAEEEVQAAYTRADKLARTRERAADAVAAQMLALGITRQEVAARLGVPTRAVKRPAPSTTPTANSRPMVEEETE